MLVEFIPLVHNPLPLFYATLLSSGIDLRAYVKSRTLTVYPNQRVIVETGYKCKLDPGFEGQIRSRSGLAANNGVIVLNAPGTIDADYDGPIKVILYNTSPDPFQIQHGDRIAQFVIVPVVREDTYMPLDVIERGTGGLGSTGVK
jgi:dUTP pyrophosphatase